MHSMREVRRMCTATAWYGFGGEGPTSLLVRGRRLLHLVRYALSDVRHRCYATALNVAAVGLADVYVLVLGFYGASIFGYQQRLLEDALPTRVEAEVPDVADRA